MLKWHCHYLTGICIVSFEMNLGEDLVQKNKTFFTEVAAKTCKVFFNRVYFSDHGCISHGYHIWSLTRIGSFDFVMDSLIKPYRVVSWSKNFPVNFRNIKYTSWFFIIFQCVNVYYTVPATGLFSFHANIINYLQWTNIDIESNVVINLIWLLQLCLINVHASGTM